MKLSAVSFTRAGGRLCGILCERLEAQGVECEGYVNRRYMDAHSREKGLCPLLVPVSEWTREKFCSRDGLIYIGAAGIAVRAVAPCLADKWTDPAVVVVDERGQYVVSLLSGHVGGANRLAVLVAGLLHATPVVTTASDVNGRMAIDVWAAGRGLAVTDRKMAKRVEAELLDGRAVGFFVEGGLAPFLCQGKKTAREEDARFLREFHKGVPCDWNVAITVQDHVELPQTLRLVPKVLSVGVGCRRGASFAQLYRAVLHAFEGRGLDPGSAARVASVSLKEDEPGLGQLSRDLKIPFVTFTAEELSQVPGCFSDSPFVRKVTGVGNVCERAAMAAAMAAAPSGSRARVGLLVRKHVEDGVTVAVAGPVTDGGDGDG